MITKKQTLFKSISLFAIAIFSTAMLFTNCRGDEDVYSKPEVTISPDEDIAFGAGAEAKVITIETNRPWRIVKEAGANWIDIAPMQGSEGKSTITVTVKSNPESAREDFFTIVSSIVKNTINVTQDGADGSTIQYITIQELREKYAAAGVDNWNISEAYKLKAIVISDRAGGNSASLRNGFIQDKSGFGIAFRTSDKNHAYNLGNELNINLKGATVSKYGDAVQVGFPTSQAKIMGDGELPAPKELTIEEINSGYYDGVLVKVKQVQFNPYIGLKYQEGEYATNRTLENCQNKNLIVRTTQYATFKDELLPEGNGNLTGILAWYKGQTGDGVWQLFVRNIEDTKEMSNDPSTRCTPSTPPVSGTHISIADFKAALVEGQAYTEDRFIEGEVILNPSQNNVVAFVAYVADATAGITLTFSDADNVISKLPLGAKVKVNMKDVRFSLYNGLIQVGSGSTLSTAKVQIVEATSSTPLTPRVVTIQDLLDGKYQSELVQINPVQFVNESTTYSGDQKIENEVGDMISVFTRAQANFATQQAPSGSGPFIGVVSRFNNPQLLIRATADLSQMTNPRFSGPTLSIDQTSLTFEAAGGSQTAALTASEAWNASSNQSWLTVSPTSGTTNATITFTATANTAETQRLATVTFTSGALTKTVSVVQKGTGSGVTATGLFISEYVEGSSYNKAIEIFNGTGAPIDLSAYSLKKQTNGAGEYVNETPLTGTLADGKTYVIAHPQASAEILALANTTSTAATNFNGNDAIALFKNGDKIDEVGVFNQVEDWGKDVTLRRKPSVRSPKATYDPSEWDSYPNNDISGLGSHTMN